MSAEAGGPVFVDLHTHSTASDGTLPPERVIDAAERCKLGALALTDHDTIDGVRMAREAGDRVGIRVIAGVELSAFDGEHEVHLLALHLSQLDALERRLLELRASRQARAGRIVEKLNTLGIPLTMEEVLKESNGGAVGRPHVARVLIARGVVVDFRDAFMRYLGANGTAFIPKDKLSVEDAIAIAHDAGALAVWAHPGDGGRRERVEPFVAAGLDGLEIRHPSHSGEDMKRLQALTDFFGLVPSGGSDWHGATDGPRRLGMMNVPRDWLDKQDERVAALTSTGRL
ncbi:MAG: PHP domain-containing protein [Gemmatimonadaceae bacterium]